MSSCNDPNCPHDIFGTCPVEAARLVVKGNPDDEADDLDTESVN